MDTNNKYRYNNTCIIYIITKLELGGAQKVCLELIQGMKSANIPVYLITGNMGILVDQAKKSCFTFLLPSFKRECTWRYFFSGELKNFFTIIRILHTLKKRYQTVIVHTHSTKAGIIGRWASFFTRIQKRIHTIHGYGFHTHQSLWKKIFIYILELTTSLITTHFVCVSKKDQYTGKAIFPFFSQKNSLIRAAVHDQFFSTTNAIPTIKKHTTTNYFIIGTIACFKPQKNIFDLLKAFKQVIDHLKQIHYDQKVKLQIIGDGSLRKQIEDWIHINDIKENIDLLGWQHDVLPLLKQWHLFALTSLWEGLPCSIIEARLLKLPVVAYDVGGIAEVIIDTTNGFLIPSGNWQLLATRILELIINKNVYKKLSENNDLLYDFTNTTMIQQHLEIYKKIT